MDEKSKIELLMREFNMNSAQFAEEVGIKNSTLSHILNDRNKPSLDVLKKILGRFQQINPEWLILDVGKMIRPILNSQEPTLFDEIPLSGSISDVYTAENSKNNQSDFLHSGINSTIPSPSSDVNEKQPIQIDKIVEKIFVPQIEYRSKNISRIIIYFDDNTFEEFGTNRSVN